MASTSHQRVAVTSDQSLVAEAIGAALSGRGFDTTTLRWPQSAASGGRPWAARRAPAPTEPADVALLLSDLDRPARLRGARLLIGQIHVPWVVLAGVPRGPVWGGLLEIGARAVVPISTNLDEVVAMLSSAAAGRNTMAADERHELVSEWRRLRTAQQEVANRVASMTPREEEVLWLLYAGTPVRAIADQLEVSEATVRSQVKRVLRKLDVNSQLAAVAALETVQQA